MGISSYVQVFEEEEYKPGVFDLQEKRSSVCDVYILDLKYSGWAGLAACCSSRAFMNLKSDSNVQRNERV
jgi:hypothetical protein